MTASASRRARATDWVGRQSSTTAVLEPTLANRLAATLDRPATYGHGDALPPGWHWLYFPDVAPTSELGSDGHPLSTVLLPAAPAPRRMWAGGQIHFRSPLVMGDTVTRASTIRAIDVKQGRSGHLVFVTIEHELRVRDTSALVETQTIVYRDLGGEPQQPRPAPVGPDRTDTWRMNSTHLFRYSALTFNSHRIHYDAQYCRDVEGYPDLVVHGPLLATLLLDSALRYGWTPTRFDYRAVAPVLVGEPFTTHVKRQDDHGRLWVGGHDGALAMDAMLWPEQKEN